MLVKSSPSDRATGVARRVPDADRRRRRRRSTSAPRTSCPTGRCGGRSSAPRSAACASASSCPAAVTDQRLVRLASRRMYRELLEGGVRIFEYRPAMTHVKALMVDDAWAVSARPTSTTDRSSTTTKSTSPSASRTVTARLRRDFEADLAASDEITIERWTARPLFEKLVGPGLLDSRTSAIALGPRARHFTLLCRGLRSDAVRRIIAWTTLTALLIAATITTAARGQRARGRRDPAARPLLLRTGDRAHHRRGRAGRQNIARCVIEADGERLLPLLSGHAVRRRRRSACTRVEFKNLPAGTYILRAQVPLVRREVLGPRPQRTHGGRTGERGSERVEVEFVTSYLLLALVDRRRPLRDLLFGHVAARLRARASS